MAAAAGGNTRLMVLYSATTVLFHNQPVLSLPIGSESVERSNRTRIYRVFTFIIYRSLDNWKSSSLNSFFTVSIETTEFVPERS